ncbi:universal stress protein UspA [Dokdonia pacifica]|uniref:Nucleotide-binding universal stress protein, UspA family n=1 Tax=Dokdonia pacifica TaxID=1627892 RepID=A0A239BGH4_9FLAO|nr:universal stress protein [Dokdonia pacifica]GGG29551.1 universal stress protein UspA [Dokdonia pacifica]SNS07040.1 Nucleotide-binding universal stress protein, UspA family [Dokdonia pacifica]
MKTKILLPTDFSKNAWNAISYATDLFKGKECEFYILNAYTSKGYVLESMMVPEPGETEFERAKTISEKGLSKILEMLSFRDRDDKHTFYTISQFNSLLEALKDIVEKKDIDMVIMGTKGSTNSKSVVFGSNAITAMEKLRNCPVIAIPEEARYGGLKEIVFPTSFKTHFKHRELQYLTTIAKHANAPIRVIHVDTDDTLDKVQKNNKQLLEECFEEVTYTFHTLHGSSISEAVRIFVESRESDMIAFINKKHAFFGSVFSKPMVKEIGLYSKVPIMALHDFRN